MDKSKLILPIGILLGCIILGGFFYASQVTKQQSIERQHQIDLQAKIETDKAKAEQDKKEYIVKRTKDCYDYETAERKKFNNVVGSYYSEVRDTCFVRFKLDKTAKTKTECSRIFYTAVPDQNTVSKIAGDTAIYDLADCLDNTFSKGI